MFLIPLFPESTDEYYSSTKDLQKFGSVSYEVLTNVMTWYEALKECAERGGHLASVHDSQHREHLTKIAKTDGFSLWIGLSSQGVGTGTLQPMLYFRETLSVCDVMICVKWSCLKCSLKNFLWEPDGLT